MPDPPKTPVWEPVVILMSIVALAPKILAFLKGKQWLFAEVLMYAAAAAMIVVFICKGLRFQMLWKKQKKD